MAVLREFAELVVRREAGAGTGELGCSADESLTIARAERKGRGEAAARTHGPAAEFGHLRSFD